MCDEPRVRVISALVFFPVYFFPFVCVFSSVFFFVVWFGVWINVMFCTMPDVKSRFFETCCSLMVIF